MPHTQIEREYLGQFTLAASRQTRQTFDFPLGERVRAMYLRIAATATIAASPVGGVAYEDPLLELIQNIQLEVDRDGLLVNAPAKALYYYAHAQQGAAPSMDEASFAANTAAAYAMSVCIPILFDDPNSLRPEDTTLATDRYSSMALRITLGAGSDMLSTAHSSGGGITLSALTCDVEWEKEAGPVRKDARPILVSKLAMEAAPIDTATETLVKLTRDPSRAIRRAVLWASNLGAASKPWSGNGNDAILNTIQMASNQRQHDRARLDSQVADETKLAWKFQTRPTGLYILDYTRDRSILSSLPTGDKSKLQIEITEDAANPAGQNLLSVMTHAVEELGK